MLNYQQFRQIEAPGWTLGWTWSRKEVIRSMWGAQATDQGDCSRFGIAKIPHCCKKDPTVVDLMPSAAPSQRVSNCCRGGIVSSWLQDPENAVSMFRIRVESARRRGRTVRLPRNFTLLAPGLGYTCGTMRKVRPTRFLAPDGRRATQALSKSYTDFRQCHCKHSSTREMTSSRLNVLISQWRGMLLARILNSLLVKRRPAAFLSQHSLAIWSLAAQRAPAVVAATQQTNEAASSEISCPLRKTSLIIDSNDIKYRALIPGRTRHWSCHDPPVEI